MAGIKKDNTYELIAEWLEEYNSAADKYKKARAKALIVSSMLPVIKRIANTIARRATDPVDDLVQAGAIGLLKAIDTYECGLNKSFRIYAGYFIIGEMKHYLRDKLNTIRVPRYIQELTYRINNFTKELTLEELNELTNDDVADALKVSKREVDRAIQIDRRGFTLSLEEMYMAENDSLGYEELFAKDNYGEAREMEDYKIILKDVIEKLPEEYRELIELYYYKDMNKKEIAELKNLTKMQITRKFKKAFTMLYKMIADDVEEKSRES